MDSDNATWCGHGVITMKKKRLICILAIVIVLILCTTLFIAHHHDVIFQRGNPVPYLWAALHIRKDNPFVKVNVEVPSGIVDIYISKKNSKAEKACPEIFNYVEKRFNVNFSEQFGSSYLFRNSEGKISISNEIYFRYFLVWTVPKELDITGNKTE